MDPAIPDIVQARAEHDAIEQLLRQLEEALTEPAPPARLPHVRRELNAAVRAHLHREDWVIYPWLLTHSSDAIAETARRLFTEMNDFAAGVATHVTRWDAEAVAADWDGYRAAAAPLIARFRRRAETENRDLYRLLLDDRAGEAA